MSREIDDRDGLVWVDHDGVIHETEEAKLFSVHGEEIWLPKSQIKDENDEVLAIPPWLAKKAGLEGDW